MTSKMEPRATRQTAQDKDKDFDFTVCSESAWKRSECDWNRRRNGASTGNISQRSSAVLARSRAYPDQVGYDDCMENYRDKMAECSRPVIENQGYWTAKYPEWGRNFDQYVAVCKAYRSEIPALCDIRGRTGKLVTDEGSAAHKAFVRKRTLLRERMNRIVKQHNDWMIPHNRRVMEAHRQSQEEESVDASAIISGLAGAISGISGARSRASAQERINVRVDLSRSRSQTQSSPRTPATYRPRSSGTR